MMNEKKPTWTCPVCDGPAKYDDLILDGYFQVEISSALISWYWSVLTIFVLQEVIKADELPEEENEIILNQVC